MVGHGPNLFTQAFRFKQAPMRSATHTSPTVELALDLKCAFNSIKNMAIIAQRNSLECGAKTYQYLQSFTNKKTLSKQGTAQLNIFY
ncbi:hypothetical protein HPB48_022277 [Haemaphysalis longicornis]|uniref:Uncharacterized protein n=1 Tax=Haemaphysalis longicornis TaxID=44386 RepID=A0A9J6FPH2_HAELO|nr:hypothetical protein HPB48_022277 [Haemaphysalis longicornis]